MISKLHEQLLRISIEKFLGVNNKMEIPTVNDGLYKVEILLKMPPPIE